MRCQWFIKGKGSSVILQDCAHIMLNSKGEEEAKRKVRNLMMGFCIMTKSFSLEKFQKKSSSNKELDSYKMWNNFWSSILLFKSQNNSNTSTLW
jgi:hypothetical protein